VRAATAVNVLAGGDAEAMRRGVEQFGGLEHALERVRTLGDVTFVNDSKATNVVSVRRALESFDGHVVAIMGGRYKGGDFGELHTPYEDASLDIHAPGEESGTYTSFIDLALGDVADARVAAGAITEDEAATLRPDYTSSADDNVIIENIGGSASSLGFVGFAFADQNADSVKTLEVDAGDGCISPAPDTIASGEYQLSRDLYI
jgi:hypothetical protein